MSIYFYKLDKQGLYLNKNNLQYQNLQKQPKCISYLLQINIYKSRLLIINLKKNTKLKAISFF